MQKKGFGFIALVAALVLVSLAINLGWTTKIPGLKDAFVSEPKMGLDVKGGFRFTIRADRSKMSPDQLAKWNETALNTVRILESRAQQALGVSESTVVRRGDDRFVVELPGFTDESEARKVLNTSARMEFWWPRNLRTKLAQFRPYESYEGIPWETGRTVTVVATKSQATITKILGSDSIEVSLPDGTVKAFTRKELSLNLENNGEVETLFKRRDADNSESIIRGTPEWDQMVKGWVAITGGENLKSASPEAGSGGNYEIHLSFTPAGTEEMDSWAKKSYIRNKSEYIAALLDNKVVSLATLLDGVTFERGEARITGTFTAKEAKQTSDLLNAGALPVDLQEENVQRISPLQGDDALKQIISAGLISFVFIAAFMLIYYVFPGFVALLALLAYVNFCYLIFLQLGVTFSLAGIAGFILSIGMAVDANILIFERLKEEMRHGKPLLSAIDLGFKRALPAILDSNACTAITCLVLMNIGTGPVKGFATTLLLGVLISLFTAVTVTRSLLTFLVQSGIGKNEKIYGMGRGWFGERLELEANEKPLNIVGKMGRYFLISILVIIPGFVFMGMGGLKPNVEFLNGVESVVQLPVGANATPASLNKSLEAAGFDGANVKLAPPAKAGLGSLAFITIPKDTNPEFKAKIDSPDTKTKLEARQTIVKAAGGDESIVSKTNEQGRTSESIAGEVSFESTSPAVREETIRGAIVGVIISSLLIMVYLAMRFGVALGGFVKGLRFGTSAMIAMLHDVFVVLGLAAIMGYFANWELSQLTITAMLTVIGFSVHDTIVIFDRIRENLRHPLEDETFDNLVNRSITQSFARSLNTSMTVIVTLGILTFYGSTTPDLKHFNAAMLFGILSGTYSSIFNAAPILVLWERVVAKRKGLQATIMHDENLRGGGHEEEDDEERRVFRRDESEGWQPDAGYAPTKRRKK